MELCFAQVSKLSNSGSLSANSITSDYIVTLRWNHGLSEGEPTGGMPPPANLHNSIADVCKKPFSARKKEEEERNGGGVQLF